MDLVRSPWASWMRPIGEMDVTGRVMSVLVLAVSVLLTGCTAVRGESGTDGRPSVSLSRSVLGDFKESRVFFAHQSVGNNILNGIELVYRDAGSVAPLIGDVAEVADEPSFIAHAMVGVNGDPESKLREFTTILEAGVANRADVVVLKFCYIDITRASDVDRIFERYSTTMDDLAEEYPDLRVVYATVPLGTKATWKSRLKAFVTREVPPDTADNIAREHYNNLVRKKYGESGRLFDIAQVESTGKDGQRVAGEHSGRNFYALDSSIAADSGHLNEVGSFLAAEAFIQIVVA